MSDMRKAVDAERFNREYAKRYYENEAEFKGMFKLDTSILNSLIKEKGKIFDPAAGRGRHVIYFAKKGFDVYGNDFNPHMVEMMKKDLKKENLKATLLNYDIANLPKIKDNFFDYIIIMYNSLGSIPGSDKRKRAIKELSRILKKGGTLVMHAHNTFGDIFNGRNIMWTLQNWVFPRKEAEPGDYFYEHESIGFTYQHMFTLDELREMFKKANLRVEKEFFLNAKQDGFYKGKLKKFRSGGFIFVGKKF